MKLKAIDQKELISYKSIFDFQELATLNTKKWLFIFVLNKKHINTFK